MLSVEQKAKEMSAPETPQCVRQQQCLDPQLTYDKVDCVTRHVCDVDLNPRAGTPCKKKSQRMTKKQLVPQNSVPLGYHPPFPTAASVPPPIVKADTKQQPRRQLYAIDIFSVLLLFVMGILVSWAVAVMIHGPCAF